MSSLITQSLSEKPLVLLIATNSLLSHQIIDFFTSSELAVIHIKPREFWKNDFLKLVKTKTSLYKIIWLNGFSDENTSKNPKNDKILSSLVDTQNHISQTHQQGAPIVIISRLTTDFSSKDGVYAKFKDQVNSEINFIRHAQIQLPQAQFICGQDVLGENNDFFSPLSFFVGGILKKTLLDPGVDVFFQTPMAFFSIFSSQLFKPHTPQTFIIKGKKHPSSFWISFIQKQYKLYFNDSLGVVRISSSTPQPHFQKSRAISVISSSQDTREFLDNKIRSLPSLSQKLDLSVGLNTGVVVKTTPQTSVLPPKTSLPTPEHNLTKSLKKELDLTNSALPHSKHQIPSYSNLVMAESPQPNQPLANVENKKKSVFLDRKLKKTPINQSKQDNKVREFTDDDVGAGVDRDLKRIFGQSRHKSSENRVVSKHKSKKKIIKKSKHKKILFYGGVGVIGVGFGVGILIFMFKLGVFFLRKDLLAFVNSYKSGGVEAVVVEEKSVTNNSKKISNSISKKWYGFLNNQVKYYSLILDENFFNSATPLLETVAELGELNKSSQEVKRSVISIYQALMGKGGVTQNKIAEFSDLSQVLFKKLSQIKGKIDTLNTSEFSQEEAQKIEDFSIEIQKNRQKATIYSQLKSFLPPFLGTEEKRVYAVLLQNNLELRPTGGFIQAVAIITLDKGLFIDSQVMSVYEIDDKLSSDVSPPAELEKILGESRWYLRDSNWDPDFLTTAKNSSWFIKESLGITVDGVIALDFNTMKDILGVIGDLNLPEYNEVITQKNLLERVELHAKDDLSRDVGAGRNYHSLILQRLLVKLQELPKEKIIPVVGVLRKSLDQKSLLISLPQKSENSVLTEMGWSGQIIQPDCPAQFSRRTCIVDTIYQVEANVGINKVNAYIDRKVDHKINVSQDRIRHTRKITYKNNSRSDNWPQGKYRTYIRFYTKSPNKLETIVLNGQKVDTDLVTQYLDGDSQVYGVLLEVPRGQETVLEIVYSMKNNWLAQARREGGDESGFSYVFFDQKQPGWIDDSLTMSLESGLGLSPKLIAPQAEVLGQNIGFEVDRVGHAFVGVEFGVE